MGKIIKLIVMIFVVMSMVLAQIFFVDGHSLASPGALPPCGNDNLPGANDSSWPDIATSKADGNQQYTAVAWGEGTSGQGAIRLAWSQAFTTTRTWSVMTVPSITDGKDPVIVFDPSQANKVHMAFQKGKTSSTIYYTTCTLGGTQCDAAVQVSGNADANKLRLNPAIATNAAGSPVIMYEENGTTDPKNWLNYSYKSTGGSFVAFEGDAVFGETGKMERSVSLASLTNTLHIAYAEGDGPFSSPLTSNRIKYLRMDISNSNLSGGALGTSTTQAFDPGVGVNEPDFPALAATPHNGGDTIVLVWQLEDSAPNDLFSLGYNISTNGGTTWDVGGSKRYDYIPSGSDGDLGSDNRKAEDKMGGRDGTFDDGLHPDVALHKDGSDLIIHSTWHQTTTNTSGSPNRIDIMYAYLKGSAPWERTNIITGTGITPLSTTNVTAFYGFSDALSKVRPKMVFGNFGSGAHTSQNRLQVVYANIIVGAGIGGSNALRAVYNGWELGSNFTNPDRTQQDSDCDTHPDSEEAVESSPSTCTGDEPTVFDTTVGGSGNEYSNCDGDVVGNNIGFGPGSPGADSVPDYLDANSDGDFQTDDVDQERYTWSNDGAPVSLPIIIKNSN